MDSIMKVVSFNLKHDFLFSRFNRWGSRRDMVTRVIQDSGASVVGVQELTPSMKEDLLLRLKGYSFYGFGRTRKHLNEHSAIVLKDEDCKMQFFKTFWLSKHPDKSGSRAYFSPFPRICTVCELFSEKLGCPVRIFNTHFDHLCAPARTLSVRVILSFMHKLNNNHKMPTILMGDMNARPSSKPIRILSQNLHSYEDIHLTSIFADEKHATYHGFKGGYRGWTIDYIFISDELEAVKAYVDTSNENGKYPSDHYPIVAELKRKAANDSPDIIK